MTTITSSKAPRRGAALWAGAVLLFFSGLMNLLPAVVTTLYYVGTYPVDGSPKLAAIVSAFSFPQLALWLGVSLGYVVAAVGAIMRARWAGRLVLGVIAADLANYALIWTSGVYGEFRGPSGVMQDVALYAMIALGAGLILKGRRGAHNTEEVLHTHARRRSN